MTRGRGEDEKEAKMGKPWLQLNSSFFYAFPVFQKDRHTSAPVLIYRLARSLTGHHSLNWLGERMGERKNLISLTFLNSDKRNCATQVLDRGPEPQEKIKTSENEIVELKLICLKCVLMNRLQRRN